MCLIEKIPKLMYEIWKVNRKHFLTDVRIVQGQSLSSKWMAVVLIELLVHVSTLVVKTNIINHNFCSCSIPTILPEHVTYHLNHVPEESDLSLLLPPIRLVAEKPESFVLSDVADVIDVNGTLSI